jgi:hypothetical protein
MEDLQARVPRYPGPVNVFWAVTEEELAEQGDAAKG